MTVSWLPHQQSVLAPPEELTTTEWSEKYIIIPSLLSPIHHGPYDSSITPYLREVQDVMGDEQHQFIDIMKSVQCGGSQATRNALLHWLSRRPYPVLLVYPDEDSAKDNLNRKILPAIKACPITAAFISGRKWDVKRRRIALTITDIAAGWSGSPQSLASDPFGSVIFDEVDKFQPFAGKDADAISLGIRRTTTFQDKRKIIRLSTPTTPLGFISRAFEASPDKRDYHLPCPHCARMFLPSFRLLSYPGKTDDRGADAARIEETRCVRMGCPECGAEIADEQKPMMVRDGKWCSRGYDFDAHPDSDRVAFHIPGIISLIGPTWSQIVANFLRAYGDYAGLMDSSTTTSVSPSRTAWTRSSPRCSRRRETRGIRNRSCRHGAPWSLLPPTLRRTTTGSPSAHGAAVACRASSRSVARSPSRTSTSAPFSPAGLSRGR